MTRANAMEIVLHAARQCAQLCADDPNASEQDQRNLELLWKAIEMLAQTEIEVDAVDEKALVIRTDGIE